MVYLLKNVIFHGYVSHNQMVAFFIPFFLSDPRLSGVPFWDLARASAHAVRLWIEKGWQMRSVPDRLCVRKNVPTINGHSEMVSNNVRHVQYTHTLTRTHTHIIYIYIHVYM